jgi:hypothetical protein
MWIASLTKLVTAIACMVAVEQGLVTLDENVRDIVPELKNIEVLLGFEDGPEPRKPITKKVDAPISLRFVASLISLTSLEEKTDIIPGNS